MSYPINVFFAGKKSIGREVFDFIITNNRPFRYKISGVLTSNDKTKWWAKYQNRIPSGAMFNPKKKYPYYIEHEYNDTLTQIHNTYKKSDLLVSVQCSHIFTEEELSFFPLGGINLHLAPLPRYRGCNSISHAIINQDKYYGVTLHWMDCKVDRGPILDIEPVKIDDTDTAWTLYKKAEQAAALLFKRNWDKVLEGRDKHPGYYPAADESFYYKRSSLIHLKDATDIRGKELWDRARALEFPTFEPVYIQTDQGKLYLSTTYG